MKVLSIDKNPYGRLFVSVQIQEEEACEAQPFVHLGNLTFYPVSPGGEHYEIRVEQHCQTALTGRTIGYGNTWAVGCGSGAAMGWSLGHSLEEAVNAARAFCSTIESFNNVARVHLNLPDRMDAYLDDPCTTPQAADIRALFDPDFVPLKQFFETGTDLDHRYASYEQALKAVGDYLLSKGLVKSCSNTGSAAAVCQ